MVLKQKEKEAELELSDVTEKAQVDDDDDVTDDVSCADHVGMDAIVAAVTSCPMLVDERKVEDFNGGEGERVKSGSNEVLKDTFGSGSTAQLTHLAELAGNFESREKTQETTATEQHYYITLEDPNGTGDYALISVDRDNSDEKSDQMDWVIATSDDEGQKVNTSERRQLDFNENGKPLDGERNEFETKENSDPLAAYEILVSTANKILNQQPPPFVRFAVPNAPSKQETGSFTPRSNAGIFCRPPTPHPHYFLANENVGSSPTTVGHQGFEFGRRLPLTSTPWSNTSSSSQRSSTGSSSSSIYTIRNNLVTLNSSGDEVNNNSSSDGAPRVPNNTPNTDSSDADLRGSFQNIRFVRSRTCPKQESHNDKERRRRNRIRSATCALRDLVPGLTERTDKATVLECVAKYIYHMKEHLGDEFDKDFIGKCSTY